MVVVAKNITLLLSKGMKVWKTQLTANNEATD